MSNPLPPDPPDSSDEEFTAAEHEYAREMAERIIEKRSRAEKKAADRKRHSLLQPKQLDIINRVRVRLGGFEMDGTRRDRDRDVEEYQTVEREFVQWLDDLRDAASNVSTEQIMKREFSNDMNIAMQRFHTEGGHVSLLDEEHIHDIMERGVIAFIEYEVRKNMYKTVGTVSALSHSVKSNEYSIPTSRKELDPMWPQYDLRDVTGGMTIDQRKNILRNYRKRLLIVRSSIRSSLSQIAPDLFKKGSPEDASLRRLGLAARGKSEIFHIAKAMGSESLTFNIGSIGTPEEPDLNTTNTPSTKHNEWMKALDFRMHYADRLTGPLKMYQRAYIGLIDRGIDEFEWDGGTQKGKGWPLSKTHNSAKHWHRVLQQEIGKGNHAPWMGE